ncbi:MAG: hypothetical protein HXL00_04570 [Candidatus Nanosynbacter sp.]|nr:hypothetical protein [Candidatus Nanosynbacter sp.]
MTYNTPPRAGDALRRTPYTANTDAECAPPGQHEQPGLLAEQLTAVVQDAITTQYRSARRRGAADRQRYDGGEVRSVYFGHETNDGQRLTLGAWAALDKDGRVHDPHIVIYEVDKYGAYAGAVRSYYLDTSDHSGVSLAEPQVFCYEYDYTKLDDAFISQDEVQPAEVDDQEMADVYALLQRATIQSPDYYTHQELDKVDRMLRPERWPLTAVDVVGQMSQRALQLAGSCLALLSKGQRIPLASHMSELVRGGASNDA